MAEKVTILAFLKSRRRSFSISRSIVSKSGCLSAFTIGETACRMTELKRRLTIDHNSAICSPMKRHRPQVPISTRERKDKVGERISALQELVSPYGKTDTASVLLEAMGYIKFLQDQVRVLSAPYLQSVPATQEESEYYSLRSRGLCLVPVEWTLKVARSNGADMWAPTMTTTKY